MTDHPTQMRPHRQLRLLAGQDAILDGQIPNPAVGQIGVFWLLFDEVPADPHDPTLSTIDADAEPLAPPRLDADHPVGRNGSFDTRSACFPGRTRSSPRHSDNGVPTRQNHPSITSSLTDIRSYGHPVPSSHSAPMQETRPSSGRSDP